MDLNETLSIQQGHLSFWQNRDGIPRMNGLDNGQTKYYLRPKIEGVVAFKKIIKKNDVVASSVGATLYHSTPPVHHLPVVHFTNKKKQTVGGGCE